jgi:UDP-N-acetylglucosamine 2-epimerase
MKYVDLLVGNTSSGIIEAASFNKPVVNIGDRQKGRLQSGNVINCKVDNVEAAIGEISAGKMTGEFNNTYGNGDAANIILNILENAEFSVVKQFVDKEIVTTTSKRTVK